MHANTLVQNVPSSTSMVNPHSHGLGASSQMTPHCRLHQKVVFTLPKKGLFRIQGLFSITLSFGKCSLRLGYCYSSVIKECSTACVWFYYLLSSSMVEAQGNGTHQSLRPHAWCSALYRSQTGSLRLGAQPAACFAAPASVGHRQQAQHYIEQVLTLSRYSN